MSGGKDKRLEIILPKHRVVNERIGVGGEGARAGDGYGAVSKSIKCSYIFRRKLKRRDKYVKSLTISNII